MNSILTILMQVLMESRHNLKFDIREGTGIITLNDPPANELAVPAFIPADRFRQWSSDPSLKGLIICGEGRNFSAGGRLDAIFTSSAEPGILEQMMTEGHELLRLIELLDIPVIAAINRVCFGGGLEIALACHIRVASENALFAFPEVNRNLIPGMGGTARLRSLTGFSNSLQMVLAGDTIGAAEAKRLGIVDHIAPKDGAIGFAMTLMQKMTRDRPLSVIRSVMKALKNASELPPEEAILEETRLFCMLARHEADRQRREEA